MSEIWFFGGLAAGHLGVLGGMMIDEGNEFRGAILGWIASIVFMAVLSAIFG
jgi:hypothetical protein